MSNQKLAKAFNDSGVFAPFTCVPGHSYVIKLRDENYYLVEGPTGYAFARGKARAKRFPTEQAAQAFAKGTLTGDLTMIDVKEV